MHRGDVILTPSWEFHDHGHEGERPMVWLDGLDLPVYQFFPANFAQQYADERFPSEPAPAESHLRYPGPTCRRGSKPTTGRTPSPNTSTGRPAAHSRGRSARRPNVSPAAPRRRRGAETAGVVYHVYKGRGATTVGNTLLEWEKGDTFCIPSWMPYRHEAAKSTYLFRYDDRPVLEAIGAYRAEASAS